MLLLTYFKTPLKICFFSIFFSLQAFSTPPTKYKGSFDQLVQTAKKENKKVIFVFTAPWCTSCAKVDKNIGEVFAKTPQFEDDYLWFDVDVTTEDGKAIAHKFHVFEIPTCVVTQSDLRQITTWSIGKGYRFMQSSLSELANW